MKSFKRSTHTIQAAQRGEKVNTKAHKETVYQKKESWIQWLERVEPKSHEQIVHKCEIKYKHF